MNTPTPTTVRVAAALGLCVIASTASAQWSVVNLHPSQFGATNSLIRGAGGAQQVGVVTTPDNVIAMATLWTGSAASYVNLNPDGIVASVALAAGGGQQGGYIFQGNDFNPAVWSGTAASFVNLLPDVGPGPARSGLVHAVAAGRQGGSVVQFPNSQSVASLWSGTAESWVNLNPAGATSSTVFGMSDHQQVGSVSFASPVRAAMWTGTAESFVNLHPFQDPTVNWSSLSASDGVQQVGTFSILGEPGPLAGLWTGTAESWVNLHPGVGVRSYATAVSDGYQVGYIELEDNFTNHAGIWNGTAASWVNLHEFLSAEYDSSDADGIFVDGNTIFVSGTAFNTLEQRYEAVMWVSVIPAPSAAPLLALAGLACARRRRA